MKLINKEKKAVRNEVAMITTTPCVNQFKCEYSPNGFEDDLFVKSMRNSKEKGKGEEERDRLLDYLGSNRESKLSPNNDSLELKKLKQDDVFLQRSKSQFQITTDDNHSHQKLLKENCTPLSKKETKQTTKGLQKFQSKGQNRGGCEKSQ